jgi:hypothetical protein
MSEIPGSAHSRYAGLLPIESSSGDFLRPIDLSREPIDLKLESIDLKPEDVPLPSARKRPRILARFPIAFCTGVVAAWLWQSYGDREMVANSYWQLGWFAPRPAPTAQNRRPPDVIDAVGQNDKISPPLMPRREPASSSTDQLAFGQEQMTRNTDEAAISVDQAPATNVTVESDAASLEPAVRLNMKPTEPKPPEILSEKGKPLSAVSEDDPSCFPSASAVVQNHAGGWPTWTLKAPGHEGTMCWYAAARPRGSDRRSESVARKKMVGTTENGLSAPFGPRGRTAELRGPWGAGLP